jgi:hypothetical protein
MYFTFSKIGEAMRKRKIFAKETGKVAVDFGKLMFASFVLGSIIKGDYDRLMILWIGGGCSLLFIIIGIILTIFAGGEE